MILLDFGNGRGRIDSFNDFFHGFNCYLSIHRCFNAYLGRRGFFRFGFHNFSPLGSRLGMTLGPVPAQLPFGSFALPVTRSAVARFTGLSAACQF